MIDRHQLLADLKPLLKVVEADLRARCDEVPQIDADLKKEYEQARAADRTGITYEEWRADLITQVAVAWVLSCVFVRFLEDNTLIAPPRISGPLHGAGTNAGLQRARDERETFFKTHPKETDRDYLLSVFDNLAKLPGVRDVFGAHNVGLAYRHWISGDAAQKLIEFFQKIDTDGTGEIIHDFTDPYRGSQGGGWDTRFLGDLYQDLSEAARKKYALLQTPIFVEEFILERTLEPAIKEFGLKDFKMIDPACGSGHFLLGGFAHILKHWRAKEPGTKDRELVNRSLAAVYGVDLNPYAVAIARFRLLVAAMRECRITRLREAPALIFNLACGDSLLHGAPGTEQHLLEFHELAHVYQSEDLPELQRILKPGGYHAVVANPPYITVKDKALNVAYRERYPEVCHRQYSLSLPFLQRLFVLAQDGGFTGQITANSFMKREFGKKLVEGYLPKVDLTHVIDTSGAYIPGHGTPTVILFGRNRRPVSKTVRAVMGIKGESGIPDDPARGLVWNAVLQQIDQAGSQSAYVSVNDTPREQLGKHPWSIGGGGAAELKELLDTRGGVKLGTLVSEIGASVVTREDEVYQIGGMTARRLRIPSAQVRPMIDGKNVRDWLFDGFERGIWPYDSDTFIATSSEYQDCYLWRFRTGLADRVAFGKSQLQHGKTWYEYSMCFPDRLRGAFRIALAEVATHNHFVLDRIGKVFKQTAPVFKLSAAATEDDHLALLGILNSSTACFWMRQVCFPKGGDHVGQEGARVRKSIWDERHAFNTTNLETLPLATNRPLSLAKQIDALAQQLSRYVPSSLVETGTPTAALLDKAAQKFAEIRGRMIAMQEELDWECYKIYGLLDDAPSCSSPPQIQLGQRAFEFILARQVAAGEEETTWFTRHGCTPTTQFPTDWPEDYKKVVQRRIDIIENDRNIALIERPEYKRRWSVESWSERQDIALRCWLLDRLERHFDLDGRMNDRREITTRGELHQPRLTSVARVADLARSDKEFMQVAEIFTARMDFDLGPLVAKLIAAESVPSLPVLRYKPAALDKCAAWMRTWELQHLEDAINSLFDVEYLKNIAGDKAEETARPFVTSLCIDSPSKPQVLRDVVSAAAYMAEAVKQKLNLGDENILKPVRDSARRAQKAAVGNIPVPPKYNSADFLSGDVWRLRGELDVPKERWVSFPNCEGEDGTLVIAWAGYDHLQLARAIAERYELAKENEGRKLVPLLAAIGELIPWLKQWHNDPDMAFGGTRMGSYFEEYLAQEAKVLGMSVEQVMAWTPPAKVKKVQKAGRKAVPIGAGGFPDNDRDVLLIAAGLSLVGPNGISEDLHLDSLILMTAQERCRAMTSDTSRFDSIIKNIDAEFWTDTGAKWKQTRNLLRQAKAIEVDVHSGQITRKEPVFTKLRNQYGKSLDDLARAAIDAARSIQTATSTIQKEQDVARKRERAVA